MRARRLVVIWVACVGCASAQPDAGGDTDSSSTAMVMNSSGDGDSSARTGEETSSAATSDTSSDEGRSSSDDGDQTWGDPVDCENHPVAGPSTVEVWGWMDGLEVELACDFSNPVDYVHHCEGQAVGFIATCTTDDGVRISLQAAPLQVGGYNDPAGQPRFAIDLRAGDQTYTLTAGNATAHRLDVVSLDQQTRRVSGTFEAAWYDLLLSGLHYPDGSLQGKFDVAF